MYLISGFSRDYICTLVVIGQQTDISLGLLAYMDYNWKTDASDFWHLLD
jgi:hypothetical protein